MSGPFSKTCVVGAGAIGGWLAAGLARAGCDVSLLARGQTLQALRAHGLRLETGASGARRTEQHPVTASADAAALGAQDLVVIAVKAPALREVAAQIGPLLGPDTAVLSAMNGVPWWFLHGLACSHAARRCAKSWRQ